ncbi:MAG TPA: acid phosphatase, partial [Paludibacter sp.]|nr:acid phosphatase [Paludibacter sp.]
MKMNAKKLFLLLMLFLCNSTGLLVVAQSVVIDKTAYRFFIVSDIGQNGYYKQKEVANTLGNMA